MTKGRRLSGAADPRAGMTVAAIGLILAFTAACAPGAGMTENVRLSLDRPERELSGALPRSIATAASPAVTVVVNHIENPARRAFFITVELSSPGRRPVRLGAVSPYPADKGGRYILSLKEGAQPMPGADLHLRLQPLNPREQGDIAVDLSITAGAAPDRR